MCKDFKKNPNYSYTMGLKTLRSIYDQQVSKKGRDSNSICVNAHCLHTRCLWGSQRRGSASSVSPLSQGPTGGENTLTWMEGACPGDGVALAVGWCLQSGQPPHDKPWTLLDDVRLGLCLLFNELRQHILPHFHSHSRVNMGFRRFVFCMFPRQSSGRVFVLFYNQKIKGNSPNM